MGAAAEHRGNALIRRYGDEASHEALQSAPTRAWAEVRILGKTLDGHIDVAVWFENRTGDLFGFSRLSLQHEEDIHAQARQAFHYWCTLHHLIADQMFYV